MAKPVFYPVKAGDEIPENVAQIMGFPEKAGQKAGVNILAFLIEGGVMKPEDLKEVAKTLRKVAQRLDTTMPVIVGGRGPLYLYAMIVHELHYFPMVATYEPRKKVGIVVVAPSKEDLGSGLTVEGTLTEVFLGGKGKIVLSAGKVDGKAVVHVEIVGDVFAEPSELRKLVYPEVPSSDVLIIEGKMPVWLASHLAAVYAHSAKAAAVYDPRLNGGVVFATHDEMYELGEVVPLTKEELQKITKPRQTKIIAVLGDPNSGKSVFLHLLEDALRKMGATTLMQEADLMAATQKWSLCAPEARKTLKKFMNIEERLRWVIESLKKEKEAGVVDVVLADVGGGRPDLGQRITRENMAILSLVDGVVIVSRNDKGQINAWIEELKTYLPNMKVYAVLESRLKGVPYIVGGQGVVVGLDRTAYCEGKIPEGTVKVAARVAERILKDEYTIAEKL